MPELAAIRAARYMDIFLHVAASLTNTEDFPAQQFLLELWADSESPGVISVMTALRKGHPCWALFIPHFDMILSTQFIHKIRNVQNIRVNSEYLNLWTVALWHLDDQGVM